jgi:SET domain-containing protein
MRKKSRRRIPTKSRWAEVRPSGLHGRGLFATRDIPEDTEIFEYVGEYLDKEESNALGIQHLEDAKKTGGGAVYLFIANEEWDIDGNFEYNTARLINHSCDPNCEAQIDDADRIWIVSLREIWKDEELTFNYGFDLEDYEEHPCLCGSARCVGYIAAEEYWPKLKRKEAAKARKAAKEGASAGQKKAKKKAPRK